MKNVQVDGGVNLWLITPENESSMIDRVSDLLSFSPTATFAELIPKPHMAQNEEVYDWYEFTFQGPLTLVYLDYEEIHEFLSIDATEKINLVTYIEKEDEAFYECENQFIRVLNSEDEIIATYYLEQECGWVHPEDEESTTNRVNKVLRSHNVPTENVKLIYVN